MNVETPIIRTSEIILASVEKEISMVVYGIYTTLGFHYFIYHWIFILISYNKKDVLEEITQGIIMRA